MVQLNYQYHRENEESVTIKVVGIGGAGSNVLDRVMLDGMDAVDLVAINTDVQSLTASVATQKIQLGRNLTRGLGTGGDPELGQEAAYEASEEIRSVLQGAHVIFVCVGLGGGTGSGAAPLITKLAKEQNALVLVFATLPFSFEGKRRCQQATESLSYLRSIADAVVCFENDRMAEMSLPKMGIHEAFAAADLTISQSIRSIAELLRRPGLMRLGFDDVCAVLKGGDARAIFGYGEADGENRAHEALERALKNPLMNRGDLLEEAHHAIVHICGGTNVTLGEVQIIMEELNRHINDRTQLFMGIGIDPKHGDRLAISLLSSLGEVESGGSGSGGYHRPISEPQPYSAPQPVSPPSSKPVTHLPEPEIIEVEAGSYQPSATSMQSQQPVSMSRPVMEQPRPPREERHQPMEQSRSGMEQPRSLREERQQPMRPMPSRPAQQPDRHDPKRIEAKQETLQFESVSRGRFEKSEPTIVDGQDLDVPTFLRKQVK
jgi:cell division protein FtsZ